MNTVKSRRIYFFHAQWWRCWKNVKLDFFCCCCCLSMEFWLTFFVYRFFCASFWMKFIETKNFICWIYILVKNLCILRQNNFKININSINNWHLIQVVISRKYQGLLNVKDIYWMHIYLLNIFLGKRLWDFKHVLLNFHIN